MGAGQRYVDLYRMGKIICPHATAASTFTTFPYYHWKYPIILVQIVLESIFSKEPS